MTGAPVARGYFLGDYYALGASGSTFKAVYGQATGTSTTPATNIYASTAG